ncbi:MAG: hypothetical protein OEZ54_10275 [Gemmatimonadota bacterium]|nr:hypothetical protein [Gemmatimonadota bacterium]
MSSRFSWYRAEQRIQQWWPVENKASVDPSISEEESWLAIDHSLSFLEKGAEQPGGGPIVGKPARAVSAAQGVMIDQAITRVRWWPARVPMKTVLSLGYLFVAVLVGLMIGSAL